MKKPEYPDFSSWVKHMFTSDGNSVQLRAEYDESTEHFRTKIKELELDLSKKIYENDHEKAEIKLLKK